MQGKMILGVLSRIECSSDPQLSTEPFAMSIKQLQHPAQLQGSAILFAIDITAQQATVLERLAGRGFKIVALPMYESCIGVRKGNCAALLAPQSSGTLRLYGQPAYLVGGNFGVKVFQPDGVYFVSKRQNRRHR